MLLSDAAYDLGCGRFGLSLRPCELEAALLLSDAAYDLGFGLFAFVPQASELLSPHRFLAMLLTI